MFCSIHTSKRRKNIHTLPFAECRHRGEFSFTIFPTAREVAFVNRGKEWGEVNQQMLGRIDGDDGKSFENRGNCGKLFFTFPTHSQKSRYTPTLLHVSWFKSYLSVAHTTFKWKLQNFIFRFIFLHFFFGADIFGTTKRFCLERDAMKR